MAGTYYYQELPLKMVIAAENKIGHLLRAEEAKLACDCDSSPAYAKLSGKNGVELYVARKRRYDSEHKCDSYFVQLLDADLNVLESVQYRQAVEGDAGFGMGDYVRNDGYYIEPLMHIAVTAIRKTRVQEV